MVPEGLPDHTGGGGGRQEHQSAGGKRDAHSIRHQHGLVGLSINVPSPLLIFTEGSAQLEPVRLGRFQCGFLSVYHCMDVGVIITVVSVFFTLLLMIYWYYVISLLLITLSREF